MEEGTGNDVCRAKDVKYPTYINYAKYGVYFDGKAFAMPSMGGFTRAVTSHEAPWSELNGLLQRLSAGIRTSGLKNTVLSGGIFKDQVGLHMIVGDADKGTDSVSLAIKTQRNILVNNKGQGNESAYGLVADGRLPLIV